MLKNLLQDLAMKSVDQAVAVMPRSTPDLAALQKCKIVSHRGEHDNRTVMENTLMAFDNASAAGVWGLECDIHFTRDQVPVICHDASLQRVFNLPDLVAQLEFAQLRERAPEVPSLAEVVARYGGDRHLMLEIKAFSPLHLPQQQRALESVLAGLRAGRDFHVLALTPQLFTLVEFLPPHCLLPVAELNVAQLSRVSLERGYAGLAGHYLLLSERIRQRHQNMAQRVGTGFPGSRNGLLREIHRGVDWVFSNDAVSLQLHLNALLAQAASNDNAMQ